MATEITAGGLTALVPWVVERATDFLRGDVVLKGGITGMLKIAHLAEAFHLGCEVHDAYNSLNNLASLHLIMAIPNCEWFEVLVPHRPGRYDLGHLSYGITEPSRSTPGASRRSLTSRDWASMWTGTSCAPAAQPSWPDTPDFPFRPDNGVLTGHPGDEQRRAASRGPISRRPVISRSPPKEPDRPASGDA